MSIKKCSLLGFQESRVKKCYGASKQIRIICNLHNFPPKLIDAIRGEVAFLLQLLLNLARSKLTNPHELIPHSKMSESQT